MVKSKKRLTQCAILLALNIAFIWGNSLLPAQISHAFSTFVRNILAAVFPATGPDNGEVGHGLVRKLAHFTEFACLGWLLSWLVRMLRNKKWEHMLLPLLTGAIIAAVDETIQLFIPERGPGILDVGIDTLGVSLGIVLINLYLSIKQNFWRKIK